MLVHLAFIFFQHREALQSDLLVSQATINELERKMDDKDTEQVSIIP